MEILHDYREVKGKCMYTIKSYTMFFMPLYSTA